MSAATEALVQSVKKELNSTVGDQIFTLCELQTDMFECGQLVNQRPIGPASPEDGIYIYPNALLLGRAPPEVLQGPFQ